MAKHKKRGKQGMLSKIINIGLTLLTFSRPLVIMFGSASTIQDKLRVLMEEATFGLSAGAFDKAAGLRMYTPAGAAAALGFIRSYATKHFPVR